MPNLNGLILTDITHHDLDELVNFLINSHWPYHGKVQHTIESATASAQAALEDEYSRLFWLRRVTDNALIGFLRLEELDEITPIFDLRIASSHRGQGMGKQALLLLQDYVFSQTNKHRLEGHTRADNMAMRKVLDSIGWMREAYYRKVWPTAEGDYLDAVAYAVLKEEVCIPNE